MTPRRKALPKIKGSSLSFNARKGPFTALNI